MRKFAKHKGKRQVAHYGLLFVICAFVVSHFSFLYAAWADHIVISEIATGASDSASDEFIELYNPTSETVNISGWKIQYSVWDKGTDATFTTKQEIPANTNLPAYRYYLAASNSTAYGHGYDGGDEDVINNWGWGLAADGGHVRIIDGSSFEKDRVGWGTAVTPEVSAAPAHGSTDPDGSIERNPGDSDPHAGNGEDSDNNGADFIVRNNRDPQSLSDGAVEPAPPPVPALDSVTDNSDGSIQVSWTPDSFEGTYSGYNIYRGLTDGNVSLYKNISDSTTLTYADWGEGAEEVVQGTTYYYKVSAESTGARNNESALSDDGYDAFSIDITAPPMLTGLTVLDTKQGRSVHLSWVPSSSQDLSNYKIGYKNGFFGFAVWGAGVSTYTIDKCSYTVVEGLSNGTPYYFRMSAIDWNGNESPISATVVSATPTDTVPPQPVEMSYITVTNEGSGSVLNLSWAGYPEPSDLANYRVYYSTYELSLPYDVHTSTFFAAVPSGVKNRSVTGLTKGVTYYFAITGVDDSDNEKNELPGPSYFISAFATDLPPQRLTTLAAVNEGSGGKIDLSWTASSESDVSYYSVYRANYAAVTKADYQWKCNISTPAVSRTVTGLTDGVTYYFGITAVDGASQEGVLSSTASAIPYDTVPPSDVSVTVTRLLPPTNGGVLMLSWTKPEDADFNGTKIYSSTGGTSGVILSSLIATLPKTTDYYCHSSLTNGLTYYYIIRPVDETGNESASVAQYQGRPLDSNSPDAVDNFSAFDRGTGGAVQLLWTALSPTEDDLRGYNIYRYSVSEGTEALTLLLSTSAISYSDTVLSTDTTYFYSIQAQDFSDNVSALSRCEVFVKDVEAYPPENITALAPAGGRIVELNWDNPPDHLEGIRIYRSLSSTTVFGVIISTLIPPTTFYRDLTVINETVHWYGVKAINYLDYSHIFESTNTDIYSALPDDSLSPMPPGNFAVFLSTVPNALVLKWSKPAENEDGSSLVDLAGYRIYWGTSGDDISNIIDEVLSSPEAESHIFKGLGSAVYYFEIEAKDSSGNFSVPSGTVSKKCESIIDVVTLSDDKETDYFTPNGDGIADSLNINFTLKESSTTVEIKVYNSIGGVVTEVLPDTYYAAVISTSVKWSPRGIPDGVYRIKVYINGDEYSSKSITIQGSAQIPPAANNYPNPFIMSRDGSTKIRWMMASR